MRIETKRLILREHVAADAATMAAAWADPRYGRFRHDWADQAAKARELVERFVDAQRAEPRLVWQLAIDDKADGRHIGTCGVRVNDPERREANIGYEIDADRWGRGYATEAATAILRYGFADLGMHRIWAECVADNAASARIMEKLGMRQEARFREHQHFKGHWWDTLIYAILDREWLAIEAGRSAKTRPTAD